MLSLEEIFQFRKPVLRIQRGAHQLDEGAVGVELLGHDEVVYGAVQAGAGEDAVEGALVVVVQLDAHAVPVRQQLLRTHRRTEVHQPRACVLRLLFNCMCTKLSALSLLYKVELDSTDILVDLQVLSCYQYVVWQESASLTMFNRLSSTAF